MTTHPRTHTTVIGGGIVGAATAYQLARRGGSVTLVESGELVSGTSAASFAWLNANDKAPYAYHLLNISGMADYSLLRRELGDAPWLHLDGHAQWMPPGEHTSYLEHKVRRLRGWGYPVEWLTRSEFRRIEPDVVVPESVQRIAYFAGEGYVDIGDFVATLARRAIAGGATIRTQFRVVDITQSGGRVGEVVGAGGERISTDAVVICAGPDVPTLASMLGVTVPMQNTAGFIAFTSATPVNIRTTITTPVVNVRPAGRGSYCIQSPSLDHSVTSDTPTSPIPTVAHEALARASQIVPQLDEAHVVAAAVGVRPIPSDGLPLVGPLPGLEGAYIIATHSGVTLGPLLGRLIAREIHTGIVDERLADFRPQQRVTTTNHR